MPYCIVVAHKTLHLNSVEEIEHAEQELTRHGQGSALIWRWEHANNRGWVKTSMSLHAKPEASGDV